MKASIKVSGNPYMVSAFYGTASEQFSAGMFISIISTNTTRCVKQIRKVFQQGNGACLIDLW